MLSLNWTLLYLPFSEKGGSFGRCEKMSSGQVLERLSWVWIKKKIKNGGPLSREHNQTLFQPKFKKGQMNERLLQVWITFPAMLIAHLQFPHISFRHLQHPLHPGQGRDGSTAPYEKIGTVTTLFVYLSNLINISLIVSVGSISYKYKFTPSGKLS